MGGGGNMLKQILELIQKEGILNPEELATRLDASPQLVKEMLAHLERTGYLKALPACESSQCRGCSLAASCNPKTPRIWTVKV